MDLDRQNLKTFFSILKWGFIGVLSLMVLILIGLLGVYQVHYKETPMPVDTFISTSFHPVTPQPEEPILYPKFPKI